MFTCRECKNVVSETATVCPHCGDVDCLYNVVVENFNKKKSKSRKIRAFWMAFLTLIIWIFLLFSIPSKNVWISILVVWVSPLLIMLLLMLLFGGSSEMKSLDRDISYYSQLKNNLKIER